MHVGPVAGQRRDLATVLGGEHVVRQVQERVDARRVGDERRLGQNRQRERQEHQPDGERIGDHRRAHDAHARVHASIGTAPAAMRTG